MIESVTIPTKLYISKVKDFEKHKDTLLALINCMPSVGTSSVSKSDWLLSSLQEKSYLDYFYKHIANDYMRDLMIEMKATSWNIGKGWYQQYEEGSYHVFHNHAKTNFTNIFYLELPDDNYKTIIKNDDGELIYNKATEGDIITFPAHLLHKSKPNGNKRKTVISFNSNFYYDL